VTVTTHWIAGTGRIIPVVILEAGTGGQTLSYTPPDPVVVRSVEDYFEFVASESCLFTDRTSAIVEAKRLRENERREAGVALARIERQERRNGTSLFPMSLSIPKVGVSDIQGPVVKVSLSTESIQIPVEVVVPKKVQEETTSPKTLLEKVVYVLGRETLSFNDICTRLQERQWLPKHRSSVSNVLSAHRNLFLCPSRSIYNLRNKPKVSPIDQESKSEGSDAETPVGGEKVDLDETLEAISEDEDEAISEDEDEDEDENEDEDEDESDEDKGESEDEDEVVQTGPISECDTWLGKPMLSVNSTHAHYHDDGNTVILSEKSNDNGKWRAEIFISGVEMWCSGSSEDRQQARDLAESNLRTKIQAIEDIIAELGI
jgi:hypothetical protein